MITETLLKDQTTGKNILWANAEFGAAKILAEQVELIKPRYDKIREHQKQRTRDRAEIFTPPDICKIQNDLIDADNKSWQDYVDAKFLEITCGEAPYLVNRYNAVTGDPIPLAERVGLLDKKLRIVGEYATDEYDWIKWAGNALQSIYGYELQGDNLYLARLNVFETIKEYFEDKFPTARLSEEILRSVAKIISWNLWQMDGLTNAIPYYKPPEKPKRKENPNQGTLAGFDSYVEKEPENVYCQIMDWKSSKTVKFKDIVKGVRR